MGVACSKYETDQKCKILVGKRILRRRWRTWQGETKRIFDKQRRVWDWIHVTSGMDQTGSCEHYNESSGSTKVY